MAYSTDAYYQNHCINGFVIDNTNSETGPVVRWKSNKQIPFDDMLKKFLADSLITVQELVNSNEQREAEVLITLQQHRQQYTGPSDEARMEARATFGPGVELVNVLTGHKWRT